MIDINKFKSAVHKYDLERPNLFAVRFGKPALFNDAPYSQMHDVVDSGRLVALFCKAATHPGRSLATAEVRRFGLGPSYKMPYFGASEDFTLTFFADSGQRVYTFFNTWLDYIFPVLPSKNMRPGERGNYQLRFKENYATNIDLMTYGGEASSMGDIFNGLLSAAASTVSAIAGVPAVGALVNQFALAPEQRDLVKKSQSTFYEAYPTAISPLSYSSESTSTISEFSVTFTYVNYDTKLYIK